ncbi:MAG: hypothetical protein HeimC3_55380 [Candidatus Heimdallarchaeota archaeon LC_3]|nr:MAG: hypothetical protein HeimC3_55380 [Candidatus Heimdallarchaeota archaeon LC_3]
MVNKLEEAVKSLKDSANLVEKTAESFFQIALKMQQIEKELKRSFHENQDKRAKSSFRIFHLNNCFTFEEKMEQFKDDFVIINDENSIIFDENK